MAADRRRRDLRRFPAAYAVMFSSLYTPLMLILFALIVRGVAFEFRGKLRAAGWRRLWDACISRQPAPRCSRA